MAGKQKKSFRPQVEQLEDRSLPSVANPMIAFHSDRDGDLDIYAMNADGSNQTQLTNNTATEQHPAWSPDGTKIAFNSDRDGNFEIYLMNADGSSQTNLTNNPVFEDQPAWSPDGSKIAFHRGQGPSSEIWVMNADGTNQTRLTNNTASDSGPAWSPDGTQIAFYSERDGIFEIYVMNADGTNQTRLTNNTVGDNNPAWSSDGTKIAFQRDPGTVNVEIYVMNADGSGQTNLTNHPANDAQPAWSPDGTQIAFRSLRDGNEEIYVMNADGSGQTRLTNNAATDGEPAWQPGAPVSSNHPPVANAGPDAVINAGSAFSSSGSFADPDPDSWMATVNYGDGSPDQPLALNPDKIFTLSHVYAQNGSYAVTVTVQDNHGGVGSDTVGVTVNEPAPAPADIAPAQKRAVVVAVLDTGVDVYHPALNGMIWTNLGEIPNNGLDDDSNGFSDDIHGFDFVNNSPNLIDGHLHGTAVAGAVASVAQVLEVPGVRVQVMPLKVVDAQDRVNEPALVRAISYALDHGADVINLSLKHAFTDEVRQALTAAQEKGVVVVSAVGNEALPEAALTGLDNVVKVAASDQGHLADFSNYGATSVMLAAPGVDVVTTLPAAGYGLASGTSLAAPQVAAAAALVRGLHPEWTPSQIITHLAQTGDLLPELQGKTISGRQLNPAAAIGLSPAIPASWTALAPNNSLELQPVGNIASQDLLFFKGLRRIVKAIGNAIVSIAKSVVNTIIDAGKSLIQTATDIVTKVIDVVKDPKKAINNLIVQIKKTIQNPGRLLNPIISALEKMGVLKTDDNYDQVRDALYQRYGAGNVYFASRNFVSWASPETLAVYTAAGILTGGASLGATLEDMKAHLVSEASQIGNWLASKAKSGHPGVDDIINAILNRKEVDGVYFAVKWTQVNYYYRGNVLGLWRPTIKSPHAAFAVVFKETPAAVPAPVQNNGIVFVPPPSPQPATSGALALAGSAYFGGSGDQRGTGIAVADGAVYVSGNAGYNYSSPPLLLKYPLAADSPTWTRTFGGSSNLNAIAATSEGVYSVGDSYSYTTDVVGGKEVKTLLGKFAVDGSSGPGPEGATWIAGSGGKGSLANLFAYSGVESFQAITTTQEGGAPVFYAAGGGQPASYYAYAVVKYDAAGNRLAAATDSSVGVDFGRVAIPSTGDSAADAVTTSNGNVYVVGGSNWSYEDAADRPALWIYDSSLKLIRRVKDSSLAGHFQGVTASARAVYAVGYAFTPGTANSENYLIEKFDESGKLVWNQNFGGPNTDVLTRVVAIGSRLFAVGYTRSEGAGGKDAVVLEIDPNTGATLSKTLYGGAQDDQANGVASDGSDLYVAGESRSFAEGGNQIGQNDGLLLHYSLQPAANPDLEELPPAMENLVSWWTAEGDANDQVGVNHGTMYGVGLARGRFGQAFDFHGGSDEVLIPNGPGLNFGHVNDQPFTFSLWMKRSSTTQGGTLVSKYNSAAITSGLRNQQYSLDVGANGKINFTLFDRTGDYRRGVQTIASFKYTDWWHHIAAGYDPTQGIAGMKLYVDGRELATTVIFNDPRYGGMHETSEYFRIGNVVQSDGSRYGFHGLIDDVAIFSRALSAAEISSLMVKPNRSPVAEAGRAYTATAGQTTTLLGWGSDADGDSLSYAWDLDNDGGFDSSGQSVTFSPRQLLPWEAEARQVVALRVTDSQGASATSQAVVTVVRPPMTITIESSDSNAAYGQALMTARVSPAPGPVALNVTSKSVRFTIRNGDTTEQRTAELIHGMAVLRGPALAASPTPYTVTAEFDGLAGVLTQNVSKASTSTTVTSSLDSSVFGQAVTLTATVSAITGGTPAPTGTVTFFIDEVNQAIMELINGQARFTTSALSAGTHHVVASYNGNSNFHGSDSYPTSYQVDKAGTTTKLTSWTESPAFGEPVTFSVTVSATAPASGTPPGSVTLVIDGLSRETVDLVNGAARFTVGDLWIGAHTVDFHYHGDDRFENSTSAPLLQQVAGPVLHSIASGDDQFFGLDSRGELWRFRSADSTWKSAGLVGTQLAVTNVGDGNSANDIVFVRDFDGRVSYWNQNFWVATGGWLNSISAGDSQIFGLGFDKRVWRFTIGKGWKALGRRGQALVVSRIGDGRAGNDVVFLQGLDYRVWVWNQTSWTNTRGWLKSMVAGDSQVFGLGLDGQVWRYRLGAGWRAAGAYGTALVVGNVGDSKPGNDSVFLRADDGRMWHWNQAVWTDLDKTLSATVAATDNQLLGLDEQGNLWDYRVGSQSGWKALGRPAASPVFASTLNRFTLDDILPLLIRAPAIQKVDKAGTATSLTSSAASVAFGEPVTFTVTVSA